MEPLTDPISEDVPSTDDDDTQENEAKVTVDNFTQEEKEILLDAQAKVQALVKRGDRPRLIKDAENSILALPQNKSLGRKEREHLLWKTKRWLSFHARTKNTKGAKRWTGRTVFYKQDPERIQDKQKSLYNKAIAKGKHPKSEFNFFQVALSYVWKKTLSETERATYRATATKWNNQGPAKEVKPQ
jgi:hypothetical protein